jgi:hypothetical protein
MKPKDYINVLYEARRIVTEQMTQRLQLELLEYYTRSVERAFELLQSGNITPENHIRWVREYQDALKNFTGGAEQIAKAEVMRTIQRAGQIHNGALTRLFEDMGVPTAFTFEGMVDEALRGHIYRRALNVGRTYKTLQARALTHITGTIERDIATALSEGKSWRALRSDLIKTVLLESDSPIELREEAQSKRILALKDFGTTDTAGRQAVKKLMFDMDRIARSEINNAYTEADRAGSERSPVVKGIKWNVSGRHAGLPSSPDICDVYAEADDHGLGPGVYFAETLPARPHPFCLCSLEYVTRPPEDWDKPKPEPSSPKELSDKYIEDILGKAKGRRDVGENEVKRIREQYNEYTKLASDVWQAV